jgi:hypothetical protein
MGSSKILAKPTFACGRGMPIPGTRTGLQAQRQIRQITLSHGQGFDLQSDVQSALWEEVFKPLVTRDDCDVHIIGNKAFIGGVFKNAMTSNRPEPALYFNGEPENEAVTSHLGLLDFTKRFWAILIHNSLPNLTMEREFQVNIRLDGSHEKSGM